MSGMGDVLGATAAIVLGVLEVAAVWRWGFQGCIDRTRWLVNRLAHGPAPKPARARPDYAEIARLEREVFGPNTYPDPSLGTSSAPRIHPPYA